MSSQALCWTRRRLGRFAAITAGMTAFVAFAGVDVQAATATTLYVSQGGVDSGTCTSTSPCATVSYALTKAASGSTIKVSGTIKDHLSITSPVTITTWPSGPAGSPAVLDGTGAGTVVTVYTAGVALSDLTVQHGYQGINNQEGTLTLTDSTVSGNTNPGEAYAGINNYGGGTMTIIDSTVAHNAGTATYGAGVYNTGTVTIIASTIAANTGGGIYSGQFDVATLGATIVSGNTGSNCLGYDGGSLSSAGHNLTSDTNGTACAFTAATDLVNKNPLLGSLANNGGPTQTMLPATTSPAANVIPNPTLPLRGVAVCPATDQRGLARPGHGETGCTIGAVETALNKASTTTVSVSPTTVATGTRVIYLAVVTPKTGSGTPTGTIAFKTGSTSLCSAVLSGGVAACGATNAPVGTDLVTGTYSGGNGYALSSGTTTLTVTP